MNERSRVVVQTMTFACAAECCDAEAKVEWMDSLYCLRDRNYVLQKRHALPEGWQEVEGSAYCPLHDVEVTATVRTPTVERIGHCFFGGFTEELVELRRSHIDGMLDEMHERARAESVSGVDCRAHSDRHCKCTDGSCGTMAAGIVGDERRLRAEVGLVRGLVREDLRKRAA